MQASTREDKTRYCKCRKAPSDFPTYGLFRGTVVTAYNDVLILTGDGWRSEESGHKVFTWH